MNIRPAGKGDLVTIERVRRETFAHFAPAHYSAEEVDNLLEDFDAAEALAMIETAACSLPKQAASSLLVQAGIGSTSDMSTLSRR